MMAASTERGWVFNIQRYSLHDGPGIRTTVFLKGCPLSCTWCHNPEGRAGDPELHVLEARCIQCGECGRVCPQRANLPADGSGQPAGCTLCGMCVDACPTGARQMIGREMTVDQVLAEVLRDRMFHDQSAGGVTLSGGEPLAQPRFARDLLDACRREALTTAVDTCGFVPTGVLLELAPRVDLFLYDVKVMDDDLHRRHTGVSNQLILHNLRTLATMHDNIWMRVPLVPGVNTDARHLRAIAELARDLSGVRQVHLLPYHAWGNSKWAAPEPGNGGRAIEPITPQQVEKAATVFRTAGVTTIIGG